MDVEPSGHLGRRSLGRLERGLDADTLDGFDSSEFLRAGALDGSTWTAVARKCRGNFARWRPGELQLDPNGTESLCRWSEYGCGRKVSPATSGFSIRAVCEVLGETGRLDLDHEWVMVQFQNPMTDPVVAATSNLQRRERHNGPDPQYYPQGFEVRLHEWDCTTAHTTETSGGLPLNVMPLATFRWDANRS